MTRPGVAAVEPRDRHVRALVAVGFGAAAALAWAWLVPASLDMYGDMDGLAEPRANPRHETGALEPSPARCAWGSSTAPRASAAAGP